MSNNVHTRNHVCDVYRVELETHASKREFRIRLRKSESVMEAGAAAGLGMREIEHSRRFGAHAISQRKVSEIIELQINAPAAISTDPLTFSPLLSSVWLRLPVMAPPLELMR